MTAKMRKKLSITAIIAAAALLCAFIVYQVYIFNASPVTTQMALASDVYKTVDTMIYAIREEAPLSVQSGGYVISLCGSGEKIAKGDPVFAVFSDEDAARAYASYSDLTKEIEYYQKLSGSTVSQYTDFDKLASDADQAVMDYAAAVYSGDLQFAQQQALDVREKITARQNASGITFDYAQMISSLESQRQSLLATAGRYQTIVSEQSGYYIPSCDGYEGLVSYADAAQMKVRDIEQALSLQPKDVSVGDAGKLIRYFDWYFVCNIDVQYMSDLKVGQIKQIHLPYSTAGDFDAEVYQINDTVDGKTAVVFHVKDMSPDLATLRVEYASIRLEAYSGYRVPNEAIRTVDGEKGVYILRDNLISFRKIDIIYAADDFSIVGNVDNKDGYIKLYDEVITEGTDLYNGKLIR